MSSLVPLNHSAISFDTTQHQLWLLRSLRRMGAWHELAIVNGTSEPMPLPSPKPTFPPHAKASAAEMNTEGRARAQCHMFRSTKKGCRL